MSLCLRLVSTFSSTKHFSASMSSFEFLPHPSTHLQRGVIHELIRHPHFAFVLIITEEQPAQKESLM